MLIDDAQVLVDGQSVMKSRRLVEGEVVDLLAEPEPVGFPQPQDIPIVVVSEDADVIVVDKPAGLIVHPGAGHPDGTLVNGLLHRFPELAAVGDPARPGIVHRLDGNTSGLLAVARTPVAYDALVAALAARTVDRGYLALVWGVPDAGSGLIDAPIGRSVRRPTRMAVRDGGRQARTRYAVERTFDRSRGQPAALLTGDRSHSSDPRAPRRDPASGRRRSRLRGDSLRARDCSSVPARRDAGIRPSGDRRATTLCRGASARSRPGARPARRLTTRCVPDACAPPSASVWFSSNVRVSSETATHTSCSTQWPSQWSCSSGSVVSGPSTAARISASEISSAGRARTYPPPTHASTARARALDRQEDLLEVGLGELGALRDLLHRRGPVGAVQREREQGTGGVVATGRHLHRAMLAHTRGPGRRSLRCRRDGNGTGAEPEGSGGGRSARAGRSALVRLAPAILRRDPEPCLPRTRRSGAWCCSCSTAWAGLSVESHRSRLPGSCPQRATHHHRRALHDGQRAHVVVDGAAAVASRDGRGPDARGRVDPRTCSDGRCRTATRVPRCVFGAAPPGVPRERRPGRHPQRVPHDGVLRGPPPGARSILRVVDDLDAGRALPVPRGRGCAVR